MLVCCAEKKVWTLMLNLMGFEFVRSEARAVARAKFRDDLRCEFGGIL